jgi:pyridoxal biosynthesis lyase PdxS
MKKAIKVLLAAVAVIGFLFLLEYTAEFVATKIPAEVVIPLFFVGLFVGLYIFFSREDN